MGLFHMGMGGGAALDEIDKSGCGKPVAAAFFQTVS
jgi:hypothetical protein